jgi:hypothetical protein
LRDEDGRFEDSFVRRQRRLPCVSSRSSPLEDARRSTKVQRGVKKSKEAGFYEHVTKPINFKRPESAIRDLTAREFSH